MADPPQSVIVGYTNYEAPRYLRAIVEMNIVGVHAVPVPPFYVIRASNGSFPAGGDALFTAKEARCFSITAEVEFGFVCLPSATLLARQEVRRVHVIPVASSSPHEIPQTEPSGVQAASRSYR